MTIAIIGAGAAGCFAAINIKRSMPSARVIVCESGIRPLAKVAITGGGRCNLTNTFARISQQAGGLKEAYPRGDKLMRRALSVFSQHDAWEWWEREGVRLVAQDDECVFPQSQDAMQIVGTLTRLMDRHGVELWLRHRVASISRTSSALDAEDAEARPDAFNIVFTDSAQTRLMADRVLVAAGGQPRSRGFDMLASLGLKIVAPVPSLFTFNIAGKWHTGLMGAVVEDTLVTLAGTKIKAHGPLLLTHWGMSGPAILRLSSYAARVLAERDYKGTVVVNWLGGITDDGAREELQRMAAENTRKLITTTPPRGLTARFWQSLLERYGIVAPATAGTGGGTLCPRWSELGRKQFSRIVTALTADQHEITGRCAFKEEFVTCGGVALSEVNPATMEARRQPGLYFAGEILDLDAITGGFNLQGAWSTGFVAAQSICASCN